MKFHKGVGGSKYKGFLIISYNALRFVNQLCVPSDLEVKNEIMKKYMRLLIFYI